MTRSDFLEKRLRQVRWILGFGWSKADFSSRYAGSKGNSWNYEESALHSKRVQFIIDAFPPDHFDSALEVGCAEGFVTRAIAQRTHRLVACDLSPEAINQARLQCQDIPNVVFNVCDIRNGPPKGFYDLCVVSDVLYYMSHREIKRILNALANQMSEGGTLLFANEWHSSYRNLTSPDQIMRHISAHPRWNTISHLTHKMGGDSTLSIGIFERKP